MSRGFSFISDRFWHLRQIVSFFLRRPALCAGCCRPPEDPKALVFYVFFPLKEQA
jgi:hypothetical protein